MNILTIEKKLWRYWFTNTFIKLLFIGLLVFSIVIIPSLNLVDIKIKQDSDLAFLFLFDVILFILSIFFGYYEQFYWKKLLYKHLDDKYQTNRFLKLLNISFYTYLSGPLYRAYLLISLFFEDGKYHFMFKYARRKKYGFSIQDISFAGILFALFLTLTLIKNFTAARIINLDFEFAFYILFAYFLGKFKGALLSFMADFFGLLFSGRIGFYHWVYAIVPIIATVLIGWFIDLFKKHKQTSMIVMNIALVVIFVILLVVFLSQVNNPKGIRISKTFGVSKISLAAGIILLVFAAAFIFIMIALTIYYLKTKNDSQSKNRIGFLVLSFFLTVALIVVARWIWGPFAFIRFANYFLGRKYTLSQHYLIFMTPIVIRSLISIPIYVFILYIILLPLSIMKKQYEKKEYGITY
ncbi:hypothetical protein ACXYRO_01750 [Mycoplasma sp. 4013]